MLSKEQIKTLIDIVKSVKVDFAGYSVLNEIIIELEKLQLTSNDKEAKDK